MHLTVARSAKPAIRWLLAAALAFTSSPGVVSQNPASKSEDTRIAALLDDLARVRTPTSVSISPDGTTVAYAFNGSSGSELHLTPIVGTSPGDRILSPDTIRNLTNTTPGVCASSHPNWSPNGKQLAFLSGCTSNNGNWQSDPQDNIFVWTTATNDFKQVSHLRGAISDLQWSPDGKSIAFLFVENATRHAGALDAMKPWNGVYGEDGVEVQRVAAVELSNQNQATFLLTPGNLHAYEFSWGTDSSRFAFVAAPPPAKTTGGFPNSIVRTFLM